jgi:SPP1 family holin
MDKASLLRFLVAILTATNTVLTALGKPVIPDDAINAITIISGYLFEIFVMFKNNYLTSKGRKQKEVLEKHGLK